MTDFGRIRGDFPLLSRRVHGRPLIYLDNAATTQLPEPVLRAVEEQYRQWQANLHRGVHWLSEQSSARVESVRRTVADFLGAAESAEIIFTSGATESVNLIARAASESLLREGDTVAATAMEHHSNLIPWQEACRRSGASLRLIPLTPCGELDMEAAERVFSERPKLLAVTAVSNVLGTVNPIARLTKAAHDAGALVFVDAAQQMRHGRVDVRKWDCDFLCFSGHKMLAPTGIGVLYGKREQLERLPPVAFGGGMVEEVTEYRADWDVLPFRFEAGTRNIAGIIGLGAAIGYIRSIGEEAVYGREAELLRQTEAVLRERPYLDILGMPGERAGAVSFNIRGLPAYDAARLLDQLGIAVRSGHHCAQPLLRALDLESAVRVSPAFYNTEEELCTLGAALDRVAALPGIRHG